jgi:DNA adenine methylase Dam
MEVERLSYIKSPIFYMGNKYKLLPQLMQIFPKNINTFYDLFGGSGVISLNAKADNILYNDLDENVSNLFMLFKNLSIEKITYHIQARIDIWELSKTNKVGFAMFKNYINSKEYDNLTEYLLDCYTISYYSFSNMIRFGKNKTLDCQTQFGKRQYNVPFGKSEFKNANHYTKIYNAIEKFKIQKIDIISKSYIEILKHTKFNKNDFIYLDPPYSNTDAVYNRKSGWCLDNDYELFNELDKLNSKGIKWCISNVKENKGNVNEHIIKWANNNNYRVIGMNKNYHSMGKGNAQTYEICIVNYEVDIEGFKIIQGELF